jgi:hypothetical protein
MPMIDIHVTRGTFQDVHQLAIEAAAVAKGVEGVPDIFLFRKNTAAFVHEMREGMPRRLLILPVPARMYWRARAAIRSLAPLEAATFRSQVPNTRGIWQCFSGFKELFSPLSY